MSDDTGPVPDPPYPEGTVLLDPARDRRWEITGVERSYRMTISPEDPDAGDTADESATYPQASVLTKLETGHLVVHPDEPQPDGLQVGKYRCKECGDTFPTKEARNGHLNAHGGDQDDS